MNIEKIAISAIIAIGIAGSAALAAGGRLDPSHRLDGSPAMNSPAAADDVSGATQTPSNLSDSLYQFFAI